MYKYDIEKIFSNIKKNKLKKSKKYALIQKDKEIVFTFFALWIICSTTSIYPYFSMYIENFKNIFILLASTIIFSGFVNYLIYFFKKDYFFNEKAKNYIICKEEIESYINSLPEKYKSEAIMKLADETWSNKGNLSFYGFLNVYNYFLPKINELNEKEFKDDFITSFSKKDTNKNDKKLAQLVSLEK